MKQNTSSQATVNQAHGVPRRDSSRSFITPKDTFLTSKLLWPTIVAHARAVLGSVVACVSSEQVMRLAVKIKRHNECHDMR